MIHVALLGFGTVGSGTAEVLTSNKSMIESYIGEEINIKYILDLREFPDSPFADRIVHDFDIILRDPEVSLVAEMMSKSWTMRSAKGLSGNSRRSRLYLMLISSPM